MADDPTRDRDCRTPSEPVPQWLQTAFDGDYTGLDAELTNAGLSAAELARLPEDDQPMQHLCLASLIENFDVGLGTLARRGQG